MSIIEIQILRKCTVMNKTALGIKLRYVHAYAEWKERDRKKKKKFNFNVQCFVSETLC